MGRYDEAAATMEEINRHPADRIWTFFYLAAIYGHLGREQDAKSAIQTFNERMARAGSRFTLSLQWVATWPFKEGRDIERLIEGLRIAGVPEHIAD